jgi:hypothetical protein
MNGSFAGADCRGASIGIRGNSIVHLEQRVVELEQANRVLEERLKAYVRTVERRDETVKALARCLLPAVMAMAERDLIGEPVKDEEPLLSFVGPGSGDWVTAGMIRKAFAFSGGHVP